MTSPHYDVKYVRKTVAALAVRRVSATSVQNRAMEGGHESELAGATDSWNPNVLKVPCNK
jgi:hypothetical protein